MEGSQENQQAWEEALDLDDFDIISSSSSSVLRPCHRLRTPKSPLNCRIPGPASAIQAAMHRNDLLTLPHFNNNNIFEGNKDLAQVSTQEYMRRVDQGSSEEFSRNPWLFAIEGVFGSTSLKDIRNCVNAQRIEKVVAVVKSCTPNGLGDMIVTLKDPTDTISATIHRKVVTAGDFGKWITPASVLVLHDVVAFSSTLASCYLNITRRNVVKLISVDCEVHYFPAETTQENTAVVAPRRIGRLSEDQQPSRNLIDNTSCQKEKEIENSAQASRLFSGKAMESSAYNKNLVESGHKAFDSFGKRRGSSCRGTQPGHETVNCEGVGIVNQSVSQQNGPELERLFRGGNCLTGKRSRPLQNPDFSTSSIAESPNKLSHCTVNDNQQTVVSSGSSLARVDLEQDDPATTGASGLKKPRLGLISRTSLQEWTDEQLCVLEMDDD